MDRRDDRKIGAGDTISRLFTCVATNDNSGTPTIYASDVSFTSATHWLTNDGVMIRIARGSST